MPKSRFRISKTARNDPLARPAPAPASSGSGNKAGGRSSSGAGPRSAEAEDSPAFAVSLLNKLSLPSTAAPALLPLTEAVWTLSALGSHIASKPIRTALLHPDQRLGQRILHALDPATYAHISAEEDAEDRLALLTQASGVLRNLCIDAPWGVRDNLGKQGLVSRCIAVLQLVVYGHEEQQSQTAVEGNGDAASAAALNKPVEEMNRKEKRHAAKAAAAGAGTVSGTAEASTKPASAHESASNPANSIITPAFLAASPHTMPLLDNIITLLWCLAESSSESLLSQLDGVHLHFGVLDEDRSRAQMTSIVLADVLLGSLQVGVEQSQASPPTTPTVKPSTTAGLLQLLASSSSGSAKPKINHAPGLRQLAVTSANALCALTDECPGFIRTLLGVQVDPIPTVTSSFPLKDATFLAKSISSRRFGDVLSTGVRTLQASLSSSTSISHQEHTALTLGVLCAAISRNVVHCASRSDELFAKRKGKGAAASSSKKNSSQSALVKVPGDAPEVEHAKDVLRLLLKEEQERNVAVLLGYVELEANASVSEGQAQSTGWLTLAQLATGTTSTGGSNAMATDAASSKDGAGLALEARRAQDRVQALQLALETLAELSSAASAVAVAEDAAEQKRAAEHAATIDEEGDHTMGEDGGEVEMEILDRDDEEAEESEGGGDEDEGMKTDEGVGKAVQTGKNGHAPGGAPAVVPFVFALVSEHKLPARLLSIARAILVAQTSAVFPSATPGSGAASDPALASTVRAVVSRSLSASANALLSVASEAPPTPSESEYLEPLNWENALGSYSKATKERFLAWADPSVLPNGTRLEKNGYEALAHLWTETWQLATGLAEVPAVVGKPLLPSAAESNGNSAAQSSGSAGAQATGAIDAKEGDESPDGRVCLEACLSILWAVARSFEPVLGLPRPTQPALFVQGDPSPFRAGPGTTVVPALQAAYLSAQSDSMRVRCLGTLGCVGRLGLLNGDGADKEELIQRNRAVGETLVAVLEASPAEGVNPAAVASSSASSGKKKAGKGQASNANAAAGTTSSHAVNLPVTSPECMVAALNAIIDLYADERADWDVPVFRKSDFLQRLRKLVSRVRAGTRAIDKRTDPSLRARADETAQNYRAFVEFRETVR
ncbi:unnamed protein product [Tilletia laevis]|uniref:SYO1-like TPR repeats domain-containing protein n=2 Tax=Tilletia TaxID=13289 RepID=A0A9N8QGG5_9BASI|nr:unnamed protein product [Tilletia caries]CAD6914293.1 unnamed protein product [Tilletia controversa]CAD6930001.1 unnamed protein product [Tilletia caries]CAD6937357.1 unnamed protein product [Tilletia laevis]CAD7067344.1 unnamed protein product [Tilletia caries]